MKTSRCSICSCEEGQASAPGVGVSSRTTSSFSASCPRKTSTTRGIQPTSPPASRAQETVGASDVTTGWRVSMATRSTWPATSMHSRNRPGRHVRFAETGQDHLQRRYHRYRPTPGIVPPHRREAKSDVKHKYFRYVVVVDFEYEISDGDLPLVLCMVAYMLDAESASHADHPTLARRVRIGATV